MTALIRKELRNYFTTLIGYIFLCVFIFVTALYFVLGNVFSLSPYYAHTLQASSIILLLVIPVITMRMFSEEERQKTSQLLFTAPVGILEIVIGKYLAAAALFLMGLAVTVIFPLWISFYGSLPAAEIFTAFIGFALLGLCLIALGQFISTLTDNQIIAAILTFGIIFLLFILDSLLINLPAPLTQVLSVFSIIGRFSDFSVGILELSGILYYIFFTLAFLSLSLARLGRKKRKPIIAAVIFAALGFLSQYAAAKVDFSENSMYSISAETKDFLNGLEEDITIHAFFYTGQDEPIFSEMLSQYEKNTDKVKLLYRDPDEYINELSDFGAEPNSIVVESETDFRVIPYDAFFEYGFDETTYQSYPVAIALEPQLTNAIRLLTSTDRQIVYRVTGHGEAALPDSLTSLLISQNYIVRDFDIFNAQAVPEDCEILIVTTPSRDYSELEAGVAASYLESGGAAAFFVDYADYPLDRLEALLADYGISYGETIVIEKEPDNIFWGTETAIIPDTVTHETTGELTDGNDNILLPRVRNIVLDEAAEGFDVTPVFVSSDSAAGENNESENAPFTLAAASSQAAEGEGKNARILAVGTSLMLDETIDSYTGGANYSFVLSAMNWLAPSEQAPLYIRSKSLEAANLIMNMEQANRIALVCVIILPAAVAGLGLFVRFRRKAL